MEKNTMMCAIFAIAVATANADTVAWWHFNGTDGADATAIESSVGDHTLTLQTLSGYPSVKFSSVSRGDTAYTQANDGVRTILDADVCGSVPLSVVQTADGETRKALYYTVPAQTLFKTNVVEGQVQMGAFTIEIISRHDNVDVTAGLNLGILNSQNNRWTFMCSHFSGGCQWWADSLYQTGKTHISAHQKSLYNFAGADNPFPCDGKWHHAAFVYDGSGTITIYRDGKSIWTSSSSVLLTSDAKTLYIGPGAAGYVGGANTDTRFTVDEVRISDVALAPSEFALSGSSGFVEGAGGTLAYWTFDAPGQNGEDVGTEYGAINSVDRRPDLALRGATFTNEATWSTGARWSGYWDTEGRYQPMFTNDVPARFIWDSVSGEIYNPDNSTSVFFRHASEQGAASQSKVGSSLHSASNFVYDIMAASNVTAECFVKCDKTFGNNTSSVLGLSRFLSRTDVYGGYCLLGLQNGGTKPVVTIPNDKATPNGSSINDGKWHHVAMNYDLLSATSVVARLYVDYRYIGQVERVYAFSYVPEDLWFVFGANGLFAFSGMIDEPRITYGPADTNHFLRAFTPRENLTGVWLVQTNATLSGAEWYSPDMAYLSARWSDGTLTASDDMPFAATRIRPGHKTVVVSKSVGFSGVGGVTVPCAALVGTNAFTIEANICGSGTVFAKKRYGGTSWSVGTDSDGYAVLGVNDLDTTTATALGDGKWHHVALTVDRISANVATLYIDGAVAGSADVSDMAVDAGNLVVGGDFIGNMIGVRFSPGCLPPAKFMTVRSVKGAMISFK